LPLPRNGYAKASFNIRGKRPNNSKGKEGSVSESQIQICPMDPNAVIATD
jgi:hypothetical protein